MFKADGVTRADSTVTYTYNGLGQVTSKTEATGDAVGYVYDNSGRLTKESRASYLDQDSTTATVTPTVDYSYDGLNNLSRTRQGGALAAAGDRITTYAYGQSGRLASMTDAAGGKHNYGYDAAGNLVQDWYERRLQTFFDGSYTSALEAVLYRRDLLGRVVGQTIAEYGDAWTRGDAQNSEYNIFGEVVRRGVNGLWQESFAYDKLGRLSATNSEDGVWRFFVYDAAGNRTLAIESEGSNLDNMTVTQALALAQPGGVPAGSAFVDGIATTITLFDKRGQVSQVRAPERELALGAARVSINRSQTVNAFGEVISETDARGFTTDYVYNVMGRLTQKIMPTVSVTSAAGLVSTTRPTENLYYDVSGRLVASRDANGNLVSQTLLAGSGYGGSQALETREFHADGGIFRTFYDQFGDVRILRNELGFDEKRTYDGMGRVETLTKRGGLVEAYSYDLLGQRIKTVQKSSTLATATIYGTSTAEYDLQGRVVATVDAANDKTTTNYVWDATIGTALGATGGWTKTVTQWAGTTYSKSKSDKSDVYGNTVSESDFGAHATSYTYDKAGRLTNKSAGATSLAYSYLNTGLTGQIVDTAGSGMNTITAFLSHDANGNRTFEQYSGTVYESLSDDSWATYVAKTNFMIQSATIAYDALNRLTSFTNKNTTGTPEVSMTQVYDAAGNIRRTNTTYYDIASGSGSRTDDKWFTYDAMNRMVIADGTLVNGAIVRNAPFQNRGVSLTYDLAGNRKTSTTEQVTYHIINGMPYPVSTTWSETYSYDKDNLLNGVSAQNISAGSAAYTLSTTTRDAQGRVSSHKEYSSANTVLHDRYNITYNARGQVTSEWTSQRKNDGDTYLSKVTNTYTQQGNLHSTVSDNYKNGVDSDSKDTSMTNSWTWYDDGTMASQSYDRDTGSSTNTIYTSTHIYDGLGRLQRVKIQDGIPRTVHFALTSDEQVLLRDVNNSGPNDPEERRHFVNGRQVAEYTNDANRHQENLNYQDSVSSHMALSAGSSKFYNGGSSATGGEFGTSSFDPLNPITAGTSAHSTSRYTVQGGDTLQAIAAHLWGDSSLWYLIADANGLSADAFLVEGHTLSIPLKGPSNKANAAMFDPYDPVGALGDLSPTTRKPPKQKKQGCGGLGQVLLMVVAVAVAIVLPQAIPALAPSAFGGGAVGAAVSGAIGAAAGSVVSQGVGLATGIQDKFSWKAVALAAIGGGVGGAMNAGGLFSKVTNPMLRAGLNGATASALAQGIGVVTGLQPKFDWAGVAAAGVGAAAGSWAGAKLGAQPITSATSSIGNYAANLGASMASNIANAATRSLINGSDFGDNIMAALPDTLGQTIGNMLAHGVSAPASEARTFKQAIAPEAAAERLFAAATGHGPQTPQEWAQARGMANIYAAAGANPDFRLAARELDAGLNRALDHLSATSPGTARRVADFRALLGQQPAASLNGLVDDITVTRSRDYLISKMIDRASIKAGELKQMFGGQVQRLLEARPGAGILLEVGSAALTVLGGPARYGVGLAYEWAQGRIENWLTEKFDSHGWSLDKAQLGGSGVTWVGEVVLGGLAGVKAGNAIALSRNRFGHTFKRHGSGATEYLTHRARATGQPQGQFLDDQVAAKFILDNVEKTTGGPVSIPVPDGFPARIIMPDGSFDAPNSIRLVPGGKGVKTAYPEL
jgi:YD repeat-containing protein